MERRKEKYKKKKSFNPVFHNTEHIVSLLCGETRNNIPEDKRYYHRATYPILCETLPTNNIRKNRPIRRIYDLNMRKKLSLSWSIFHVRQSTTRTTPVSSKIIVRVLSIYTEVIIYGVGHALLVYTC